MTGRKGLREQAENPALNPNRRARVAMELLDDPGEDGLAIDPGVIRAIALAYGAAQALRAATRSSGVDRLDNLETAVSLQPSGGRGGLLLTRALAVLGRNGDAMASLDDELEWLMSEDQSGIEATPTRFAFGSHLVDTFHALGIRSWTPWIDAVFARSKPAADFVYHSLQAARPPSELSSFRNLMLAGLDEARMRYWARRAE